MLSTLPFVYILPWSRNETKKYRNIAMKIHTLIVMICSLLYISFRIKYGSNFKDLPKQIVSSSTREFLFKGCKLLHFEPISKKKRRLLVFPGLGISVRRMLQETCMDAFVKDSEIVCFQIRGLGESNWDVDLSAKSMLEDSLNMMTFFDSITDKTLPTLFIGYSLGCFVSMQSLRYTEITGIRCEHILLVNGMCSGESMVFHFKMFAKILDVNVKSHLKSSMVPITILHSKDDKTIPLTEAIELKRECDHIGRACNILVCDGDHSNYKISRKNILILQSL